MLIYDITDFSLLECQKNYFLPPQCRTGLATASPKNIKDNKLGLKITFLCQLFEQRH